MSFKENAYQQMSFTDSFSGLTAREQKALERSWAKVFADEIFTMKQNLQNSQKSANYPYLVQKG